MVAGLVIDEPDRWSSIEELQAATDAYQRTWWVDDDGVRDECARRVGLLEDLTRLPAVSTADVYRIGLGTWSPERESLHDTLVPGQIGVGDPRDRPRAYFTIGSMGAGKTSVLRKFVEAHRRVSGEVSVQNLSRVAADEIRERLPEYNIGLGSMVVHQECLEVTYDLVLPRARDAKVDLTFDTIGTIGPDDSISFEPSLVELREAGFEIHVLLATAPFDTCVERAKARALKVGRLVDRTVVERLYEHPAVVLERLVGSSAVDGWASVDTSTPGPPWPITGASDEWRNVVP